MTSAGLIAGAAVPGTGCVDKSVNGEGNVSCWSDSLGIICPLPGGHGVIENNFIIMYIIIPSNPSLQPNHKTTRIFILQLNDDDFYTTNNCVFQPTAILCLLQLGVSWNTRSRGKWKRYGG